jgi:hypothetical protein
LAASSAYFFSLSVLLLSKASSISIIDIISSFALVRFFSSGYFPAFRFSSEASSRLLDFLGNRLGLLRLLLCLSFTVLISS